MCDIALHPSPSPHPLHRLPLTSPLAPPTPITDPPTHPPTPGEDPQAAELLSAVDWTVARSGSTVQLPEGRELRAVLTPTPRWPDLRCVYDSASSLLFTSKIFSAHVAPAYTGGRVSLPAPRGGECRQGR